MLAARAGAGGYGEGGQLGQGAGRLRREVGQQGRGAGRVGLGRAGIAGGRAGVAGGRRLGRAGAAHRVDDAVVVGVEGGEDEGRLLHGQPLPLRRRTRGQSGAARSVGVYGRGRPAPASLRRGPRPAAVASTARCALTTTGRWVDENNGPVPSRWQTSQGRSRAGGRRVRWADENNGPVGRRVRWADENNGPVGRRARWADENNGPVGRRARWADEPNGPSETSVGGQTRPGEHAGRRLQPPQRNMRIENGSGSRIDPERRPFAPALCAHPCRRADEPGRARGWARLVWLWRLFSYLGCAARPGVDRSLLRAVCFLLRNIWWGQGLGDAGWGGGGRPGKGSPWRRRPRRARSR